MLDAIVRIELQRLPNAEEKSTNHTIPAPFLPKNAVKWAAGLGLGLLAGAVALSAHVRSVLWSAWPFLILLLCPLMHLFMHRAHGGHGSGGCHGREETGAPSNANRPSAALKDEPRRLLGDKDKE
jgi:hypothetical protein